MQSRRNFLRSGVMSALSVTLAAGVGRMAFGQQRNPNAAFDFAIPSEARQETLFYYNQAAFESYLGSTFTALGATGRTVELVLVSVTGYATKSKARIITTEARVSKSECFTLSFSPSGLLPGFTTIHTLHHDALGDIDLFVTERKTESGAIFYDAVINHDGPMTSGPGGPVFHTEESPRMPASNPESPQQVPRPTSVQSPTSSPKGSRPRAQSPESFHVDWN